MLDSMILPVKLQERHEKGLQQVRCQVQFQTGIPKMEDSDFRQDDEKRFRWLDRHLLSKSPS